MIAGLRSSYERNPLYAVTTLVPFVRVVAFNGAREAALQSLATDRHVGDTHPEHEVRVDALVDAVDLLAFLDGRPSPIRVQ